MKKFCWEVKALIVVGCLIFLCVGVVAVWVISYDGEVVYEVTSDPLISFAWDLESSDINATAGDVTRLKVLTITNNNAPKTYNIYWNLTQEDVLDSCDDYIDDVSLVVTQGNFQALGQGAGFSVPSGDYPINFELTALKGSCPQSVSVNVQLIPNS